jgi:hypothetical protein
LLARLRQLGKAIALLPPWSACHAHDDLYRARLGLEIPYWQESPLEIQPLSKPGPGW